jgi:hypothetical protein
MIRFFRGSGIGPFLMVILFAVALWIEYFLTPPQMLYPLADKPMPLWGLVLNAFEGLPLLAVIFSFSLMLVVSIVMVRFNTSIFFINRRTYFPALFYILLFSTFPGEMVLNPVLPAALLIVIALWRMLSAYRLNGMVLNFFDAALLVSSAGMFYAGSLWFFLIVVVGVLMLRTSDIREVSMAFVGVLLPWILLFAVWYLTGRNITDLSEIIRHNLFDEMPSVYWSRTLIILLIVIGLNFLPALFALFREMPTKKIRSRKTFELFLWMLAVCAAIYVFVPAVSIELGVLAAIPLSYIMAGYCTFTRRLATTEILLWLMIVMIVIARLWPY